MKRIYVFILVLALFGLLAWTSGFNFDHRGFWVAYGLGGSILLAALAAAFPGLE